MLWLYFTGAAILIGAEINSEIENAAAEAGDAEAKEEGERAPDDDSTALKNESKGEERGVKTAEKATLKPQPAMAREAVKEKSTKPQAVELFEDDQPKNLNWAAKIVAVGSMITGIFYNFRKNENDKQRG